MNLPADAQHTPCNLLIVDDDDALRQALARNFRRQGLVPRLAAGGGAALEALARSPADVVVLDVRMPDLDGLTVLERLKQQWPDTEVILLTGHANMDDGVAGIKAGAFDYLAKPVEPDHLMEKIRQAHARKVMLAERRSQAAYRAAMEKRLAQAQRLAALGTMVAGVAHEINNPLAIVHEAAGWLRILQEREDGGTVVTSADRLRALDKIDSGVERIRRITHQLLLSVRRNEVVVQAVDPAVLTDEVIKSFAERAARKGVALSREGPAGEEVVWSDPFTIRQVLINLVSNALDATEAGGRIKVRLAGQADGIGLTVEDNGGGIPEENLERVF